MNWHSGCYQRWAEIGQMCPASSMPRMLLLLRARWGVRRAASVPTLAHTVEMVSRVIVMNAACARNKGTRRTATNEG
ncbi:hypothetical protein BC826DRAFT_1014073 [Russula brevipes]|nr:hypothetical protein BC826DRAFT_1014073 [Russula brevipes]